MERSVCPGRPSRPGWVAAALLCCLAVAGPGGSAAGQVAAQRNRGATALPGDRAEVEVPGFLSRAEVKRGLRERRRRIKRRHAHGLRNREASRRARGAGRPRYGVPGAAEGAPARPQAPGGELAVRNGGGR